MEQLIGQIFGGLVPVALLTFGFVSYIIHSSKFKPLEIKDYDPSDWQLENLDEKTIKVKDIQYLGGNRRNLVYEICDAAGDIVDRGARFISKDMNPFDENEITETFDAENVKFAYKYEKIQKADQLTNKVYKNNNDNWTDEQNKRFERMLGALDDRVNELEKIDLVNLVYEGQFDCIDTSFKHVADLYHDIDELCRYFENNFDKENFSDVEKFNKSLLRAGSLEGNFIDDEEAIYFSFDKKMVTNGVKTYKKEPAL